MSTWGNFMDDEHGFEDGEREQYQAELDREQEQVDLDDRMDYEFYQDDWRLNQLDLPKDWQNPLDTFS